MSGTPNSSSARSATSTLTSSLAVSATSRPASSARARRRRPDPARHPLMARRPSLRAGHVLGVRVEQPDLAGRSPASGPRAPDRPGAHDRHGRAGARRPRPARRDHEPLDPHLEEDGHRRRRDDRHEDEHGEDLGRDQSLLQSDPGHDDLHGATAVHRAAGHQALTPAVPGRQVEQGGAEDLAERGRRHHGNEQRPSSRARPTGRSGIRR